jgi:hypothetical protein
MTDTSMMSNGRSYLFVAGMPRSGTTLVDKLLSSHERAFVLSQPLPLLYVRLKKEFLDQYGGAAARTRVATVYALNDMFGDNYYPPERLLDFLQGLRIEPGLVRQVLESMLDFNGQYTKPAQPLQVLEGHRASSLLELVTRYTELLLPPRELSVIGSKENYYEEMIPYFLAEGGRVLYITRDPRDIITSLSHGRGATFSGPRKPDLFTIRQWRKSIAFALAHQDHAGFLMVRYEDLVTSPQQVLGQVTRFLGIGELPEEVLASDLRAQDGSIWLSNSSHSSTSLISTASIGRYRCHLSPERDRLIQACCYPELRLLGYQLDLARHQVAAELGRRELEEPLARPALEDYLWSPARSDEELERWQRLQEDGGCQPELFVFDEVFRQLRQALS